MYDYRHMTPAERAAVVAERKAQGRPWHGPPHLELGRDRYILTAACYEHQDILAAPARLSEFADALLPGLQRELGAIVWGWVVLPNHYHLLVETDLAVFRVWIGRLHNGKSTQWNREDGTPGRKVWHRFLDRAIRSERHYYASLNYIHANAAKHGYVDDASHWPWSSLHEYLDSVGREVLVDWWRRFPVRDYGRGWDD